MACSCQYQYVVDNFNTYDYVAHVRVMSVIDNPDKTSFYERQGNIEVLTLFKGSEDKTPVIIGSKKSSGASCSRAVEKGEYLVFSNNHKAPIGQCSPTININKRNSTYRDYHLGLIEHLKNIKNGVKSDFKPKLDHRKVSIILKSHRDNINDIFFSHPANQGISSKTYVRGMVYINKRGYVTKIRFPDKFKVDHAVLTSIESYLKKIKFRESYQDAKFSFFIRNFK